MRVQSFQDRFLAFDWASTPLGPIDSWPTALAGPVEYLLKTHQPMFFLAGPEMVLLFNEALQRLIGERWTDALGRSVRDLWQPIWPRIGPLVERAYAGESFLVQDMAFPTWSSAFTEERYFSLAFTSLTDNRKQVVGTCCSCSDTTDSVLRATRAIEQRDAMLRHLDDSPSFALATEGRDHRIIYANARFEHLTQRKITIGVPARVMFPESTRQGVIDILDHVLASAETVTLTRQPYEIELPDGVVTSRTLTLIYEPLFGADGAPIGTLILGTDESTEVATERKVESLEAELIHATRVNAMGTLSSVLAHELNQPLAAIANYAATAELLIEREAAPAAVLKCLREVSKSAVRAGEIIRSLREMVRKGTPKREVFALQPIVADSVRLARASEHPGRVDVDVPARLRVWGDPTQVKQVMLNLIRNAVESGGPGSGPVKVTARPRRGKVEITVADTGPGIPASQLGGVFDAFSTSKEEGLGLGLSICRTIVETHGGQIEARNNPGGGAAIVFDLPASELV